MRRPMAVLLLALVLPLAACSDGTSPEESINGVYTLQTVNGINLPWVAFEASAGKVEVVSGSVTLRSDGSFTDLTTFRITENGVARNEDDVYTGTFVKSLIGVTLNPIGFQSYDVQIEGAMMTQLIGDSRLVYRK
jgi:hypothetical protein